MTRTESESERLRPQIQVELRQGLLGSRNPVKAFARNSFGPELDLNPVEVHHPRRKPMIFPVEPSLNRFISAIAS